MRSSSSNCSILRTLSDSSMRSFNSSRLFCCDNSFVSRSRESCKNYWLFAIWRFFYVSDHRRHYSWMLNLITLENPWVRQRLTLMKELHRLFNGESKKKIRIIVEPDSRFSTKIGFKNVLAVFREIVFISDHPCNDVLQSLLLYLRNGFKITNLPSYAVLGRSDCPF